MRDSFSRKTIDKFGINTGIIQFFRTVEHSNIDIEKIRTHLSRLENLCEDEAEISNLVLEYASLKQELMELRILIDPDEHRTLHEQIHRIRKAMDNRKDICNRDREIRRQKATLEIIAGVLNDMQKTFGPYVEFALHDLTEYPRNINTLKHIFGNVTKRPRGAPMTDLGDKIISEGYSKINYSTDKLAKEKKIKGSSILIHDRDDRQFSILCINLDLDAIRNNTEDFLETIGKIEISEDEIFAKTAEELVTLMVDREVTDANREKYGRQFLTYLVESTPLFREQYYQLSVMKVADRLGITSAAVEREVELIKNKN